MIPPESHEADLYAHHGGAEYERVWQILKDGCEIPPSLEQFEHVRENMEQQTPCITPERVARILASTYRRIRSL